MLVLVKALDRGRTRTAIDSVHAPRGGPSIHDALTSNILVPCISATFEAIVVGLASARWQYATPAHALSDRATDARASLITALPSGGSFYQGTSAHNLTTLRLSNRLSNLVPTARIKRARSSSIAHLLVDADGVACLTRSLIVSNITIPSLRSDPNSTNAML